MVIAVWSRFSPLRQSVGSELAGRRQTPGQHWDNVMIDGLYVDHIGLDVTDQRHEIETRATWLVWPRGYCVMQNHLQIADKLSRYQHETGGLCIIQARYLMRWMNEWGYRPPLCTDRLNWTRRTSWECWDEWDDTALQTQDSTFDASGLRPSSIPLSHRGSPRYWIFMSEQKNWMPARGSNTRSPTFQADTFNHCTRMNEYISLNTQNWSKTAIFLSPTSSTISLFHMHERSHDNMLVTLLISLGHCPPLENADSVPNRLKQRRWFLAYLW